MKNIIMVLAAMLVLAGCSKDTKEEDGYTASYPQDLQGTLYYKWATEGIVSIYLPEGKGASFLPDDVKLNNMDISRDRQLLLTSRNASTTGSDKVKFTLSNMQDGKIISEFTYVSPAGNSYCKGWLSPDNSLILVSSNDVEDGITILKTNGELLLRIDGMGGKPFSMHDEMMWLPNNGILLTFDNNIIKVEPPYNSGTLIRKMEGEDWGDLSVDHAGKKIALRAGRHIFTMDINGGNYTQITTSNFNEAKPLFSPDSKYLLIGSNYRTSSVMSHTWDLKIIPNDNKQYNVDPQEQNTPGVIPVIWNGKQKIETASGLMIWK